MQSLWGRYEQETSQCLLLLPKMSLFENGQHTLPSGIRADVGRLNSRIQMKGSNFPRLKGSEAAGAAATPQ